MRYGYRCKNKNCIEENKDKIVTKPMSLYKREEYCKSCGKAMSIKISSPSISTNDGYKS